MGNDLKIVCLNQSNIIDNEYDEYKEQNTK